MLGGPIGFTLLAAAVHRYPFDGARLTTFLVPGVLLLSCIGIEFFFRWMSGRNKLIAIIPGIFLVGIAMYWAVLHLANTRSAGPSSTDCEYARSHSQPEDGIYVFQDREWNCYWPEHDPRVRYQVDRADQIPFRRFWIIWSFPNEKGLKRINRLLDWANQFSTRLDTKIDKRGGGCISIRRKGRHHSLPLSNRPR